MTKYEHPQVDNSDTIWHWAGMKYDDFERLNASARRVWAERWAARLEVKYRDMGMRVKSTHFPGEHIDDVLKRLGLDARGNLIESDAEILGTAPRHVEDHTPPDTRPWNEIAEDAARAFRARMEAQIERNAIRREQA